LFVVGATVLAVLAAAVAGGGLYTASVPTPTLEPLASSTTLYYADGTTVLARIGNVDRTVLGYEEFLPVVAQVAVAAEDPSFWESGTGGAITRSVARQATELADGSSAATRARILVQAWKLGRTYPKEEILAYYLNAANFGRQTYGVEAAAQTYFNKTARRDAPPDKQLTAAEAMVLLAVVRQPYPDAADPASPGFDPGTSAAAELNSRQRWTEIRSEMVTLGYLSSDDAAQMSYVEPRAPQSGPRGVGSLPVGLVVNHVLDELSHAEGSALRGRSWQSIRDGGFRITTTIDQRAQQVLEQAADETVDGSVMHGQPANLQAAGAVVEPGTGRVLAYFGGHDGLGNDFASFYVDERGDATGIGRYPPGATFMAYTLAAALKAGFSLDSRWEWTPHAQPGRPTDNPIRNVGECSSNPSGRTCSLLESVALSLNVPLYDVTQIVGANHVLALARDAGIDTMWTDDRARVDLRTTDVNTLLPSRFDLVLGIGQYPVTVLDQANAMATFAAGGLRARAHFVRTVASGAEVVYGEPVPDAGQARILTAAQVADLSYALSSSPGSGGIAIKQGTWEFNRDLNKTAHAWSIGYTSAVAMAVWIGNKAEEQGLVDRTGATIWGSGLPSTILRAVVTGTQTQLGLKPTPFPPPTTTAAANPSGSIPG
jgi:membrane peptidoglycan carboxypeptidase